MFREEVAKKLETKCTMAEFGSWIWGAVDKYMESNKGVTLIDTPKIQVKVSMNVMALASNNTDKFQESGVFSSLREIITWKLLVNVKSVESKRQQQEQRARAEAVRSAWGLLPLDMERLELGTARRVMTAPAYKRSRNPKQNNCRGIVETVINCYESLGNYISKEWDNPVLQMDSLMEVLEVIDTSMTNQHEDMELGITPARSDKEHSSQERWRRAGSHPRG